MKKTFEIGSGRFRARVGVIARGADKEVLKDALMEGGRGNVVMARVSDDALARIDQLVEATVFASRSECAAFLIGAGIASQKEMFDRLNAHTDEIRKLKEQLRQVAMDAMKPKE
ncbi:MAG: hypothetical protein ACLP59_33320 [Bryobacteraceae bacterium]